jgi:hypothetical protein
MKYKYKNDDITNQIWIRIWMKMKMKMKKRMQKRASILYIAIHLNVNYHWRLLIERFVVCDNPTFKELFKAKKKSDLQVINLQVNLDLSNEILQTRIILFYCFHCVYDIQEPNNGIRAFIRIFRVVWLHVLLLLVSIRNYVYVWNNFFPKKTIFSHDFLNQTNRNCFKPRLLF